MRGLVTAVVLLFGVNVAAAQLCVGNSNFALSHFHSSVDVDIDNLAHLYTAEIRYRYQHLFAGLEYGLKSWEITTLNGSSRAFALTVGLSTQRGKAKVDLCPSLSYRSLAGPEAINGSVWRFDDKSYSVGLSAGVLAARTKLWDVTPTASLTVASGNPKLTSASGGNLASYQDFCCGSQSFTLLSVGVGFGFTDEITLIPRVSWPLGDVGRTTYGIVATLRLGKGL